MIKNINSYLGKVIMLSSIFLIFSCNENSFTTIIDIDVAEHEPKLTVGSRIFLNVADSFGLINHVVTVGKSRGINTSGIQNELQNSKVFLFENDQLIDEGIEGRIKAYNQFGNRDSILAYKLTFRDYKPGIEYKLVVENEGLTSVESVQTFYEADSFEVVEYVKDGKVSTDGSKADGINVKINNPGDNDYYLIEGEYLFERMNPDTIYTTIDQIYLDSDDPLLKSIINGGILLKGADINDQHTELKMFSYGYYASHLGSGTKLRLKLHTITKEYYLFLLSFNQYQLSIDNPFAEPVEVYSNIENGFGIFSMESILEKVIDIQ